MKSSFFVFLGSITINCKNDCVALMTGAFAVAVIRCNYGAKQVFPGSSLPTVRRTTKVSTINGTILTFDVYIPTEIEKVEMSKIQR